MVGPASLVQRQVAGLPEQTYPSVHATPLPHLQVPDSQCSIAGHRSVLPLQRHAVGDPEHVKPSVQLELTLHLQTPPSQCSFVGH